MLSDNEHKIILVDMDQTITDFILQFEIKWHETYPNIPGGVAASHAMFAGGAKPSPEMIKLVISVQCAPGFFVSMPELPGAAKALREMLAEGLQPRICTSPMPGAPHSLTEKLLWVERVLGSDFVDRLVIRTDKTGERGRLLIDDKPSVTGFLVPTWEHVLFESRNNGHVTGKRRLASWANWREVVY